MASSSKRMARLDVVPASMARMYFMIHLGLEKFPALAGKKTTYAMRGRASFKAMPKTAPSIMSLMRSIFFQ